VQFYQNKTKLQQILNNQSQPEVEHYY